MSFDTPILFIIYNRPDLTEKIFNQIRLIKPKKLFVAADGPKQGKKGDIEKCQAARNILTQIDWQCEVNTLFSNSNLGCKIGESKPMNWFFDNVSEGIIIEDDTLPDTSFFYFCENLLNYYRSEERVSMISGNNFQFGIKRGSASYYFSKITHTWGWASWRRAWRSYDVQIKTFPTFRKENKIKEIFEHEGLQKYFLQNLEGTYKNKLDTWDYQWTYAIWLQDGYCIIPNVNLIKNLGFRSDATHTKTYNEKCSNMDVGEIKEIIHPSQIRRDQDAEIHTYNLLYAPQPIAKRLKNKIKTIQQRLYEYFTDRDH
ncbi:MAG: hypothetical protein A3I11_04160 [Elusimicrobia bacterium RIFCSPLOWO2_02_FULL_39_32]|nr:MAG: hypothetical protein A2034_06500 [Elusimicrobia bacterium GWA2_38_7]OGR79568.1 MAG: hypothetical protein A3B80_02735 [Elusimicrobia bacterium RIFCSPHIGHO2_02_FULL_39_36]OGR92894.1 MAG: hypothetical protein A3I11_04160 [Elusimicrobia bacterium RIFCSPLOWO2_02_FULL_39_32]OGR99678.1 MAG: hypothetical protein A3G85_01525 [Elusimicrobia bacterium RIFCSPLOWO2_12_FULL_39_28]